eukprot:TRINITY_DN1847_c0_g1_i2.p2 TRINITY_DN1847_c0_g1~~TRINITY_DN1847_c0_g1_i2.p2  ORF type:complete len:127 (+),score=16.10 TRINITY_DN1847_c0_g1_i2:94-474(+)
MQALSTALVCARRPWGRDEVPGVLMRANNRLKEKRLTPFDVLLFTLRVLSGLDTIDKVHGDVREPTKIISGLSIGPQGAPHRGRGHGAVLKCRCEREVCTLCCVSVHQHFALSMAYLNSTWIVAEC